MPFQISYNTEELRCAAKVVWENNTYAKNWADSESDVERQIRDFMIDHGTRNLRRLEESIKLGRAVEGWDDYVGTGGYYCTFYEATETDSEGNRIGNLIVHADILVDPSLGTDRISLHYQTLVVDS